jgi:hypothetical protein
MLADLTPAVDVGLAVLAWTVQLVAYPALAFVEANRFRDWHVLHSRRISIVVVPLMLGQAALHAAALVTAPSPRNAAAAILVLTAWLLTFLGAVPCHRLLRVGGFDREVHRRLLRFNLLRTLAWTAVVVLAFIG